ncbi:MAG: class I SAM-dependent methyltransferase [Pseudomonadota bacterium]
MKAYGELVGEVGRRIHYRADRYKVRDLFRRVLPDVTVDHSSFTLHDLSMSGFAVFAGRQDDWHGEIDAELPIRLRLGNAVLHEGLGRVRRVEPTPFGTKVALQIINGYLDIPALVSVHDEACLRQELAGGLEAANDRIAPAYRQLVADVLHLLRRYRLALDKFDRPTNPHTPADDVRMAEALSICEERILPECRALWYQANALVEPALEDPETLRQTKRFTELVLTPEFLEGPIWKRSYEKPLGYPGDYEVMNYVYAWRRQGATAFGKLLHRVGLDGMECIANRMVMMQQTIAEVVARKTGPVHITNLACGPAQEVVNYLKLAHLPNPVHLTLIDQDQRALAQAYERTYPETLRLAGQASVNCLHVAFVQLMKGEKILEKIPPQDLIYAIGLVDYLSARQASTLLKSLYQQLAPGGCLVIGNVKKGRHGLLWPAEFLCDWSLVYRTEADLADLARDLPTATRTIKSDATDRIQLLYLQRPKP